VHKFSANVNLDVPVKVNVPYLPNVAGEVPAVETEDGDVDFEDESENREVPIEIPSVSSSKAQLNKSVLKLFCKLYSDPKLPRNFVQDLLKDVSDLIHDTVAVVKSVLNEEPSDNAVTKYEEIVKSPFEEFRSEHQRFKALQEMGYLTYPEEYLIGNEMVEKRVDKRIVKELGSFCGQFVSLKLNLKKFFELPGVFDTVSSYVEMLEREENVLSNFVQGELWRKKKRDWYQDKTVFPLGIYHDDFSVNNPLGTHATVQTLGGTYVTLMCLPPEFRSTVDNIFLAMLFHSADRKQFGNEAAFQPLIDEIIYLQENGIELELPQGKKTVYFALGLIEGDMLALSSITGHMLCSALLFCRLCKVTSKESKQACTLDLDKLRTVENYLVDAGGGPRTGIVEDSCWNNVGKDYHVTKNCYSDPSHDLDEGAYRYAMGHIVHYFVHDAPINVSLNILNDRLRTFDYYRNNVSNRPPVMSESEVSEKRLKMSASEMHNFVAIFPFLVGDLIDTEDEVWYFYTVLRKIHDLVYAPRLQIEAAEYLSVLIEEHHRLYLKLFNDPLKPKHHNMLHYGMIIRQAGPLKQLSTLRCESKNKEFKTRAEITNSRKNITLTLSVKEQLQFANRLLIGKGLEPKLEFGPICSIDEPFILSSDRRTEIPLPENFQNDAIKFPWINFKGTTYRIGNFLAYDVDVFDRPLFGIVEHLICNSSMDVKAVLRCYITVGLNERLCSYQIEPDRTFRVVGFDELLSYSPCVYTMVPDGREYVSPRHAL